MNGHDRSNEESPRLFARRPPGLETLTGPEGTPKKSSLSGEQDSGPEPTSWTRRLAQAGLLIGGTVLLHLLLDRGETRRTGPRSSQRQLGVNPTGSLSRRSHRRL